jgi:hypothetical protein
MVIELGVSNHQAQVLSVLHNNYASENRRVLKTHFGDDNIRKFRYLLKRRRGKKYLQTQR